MKILRSIAAFLLCAFFCVTGCQRNDRNFAGSETKAIGQPLHITEMVIGEMKHVASGSRQHLSKNPVILNIQTVGDSQDVELEAKLINLKTGQQAGLVKKRIVANGPTSTTLEFKNPHDWDVGRYLIEIKLDGKLVEQRDFDVITEALIEK